MTSLLIFLAAAVHLGAFVSYPQSGKFGPTFLYISILLWTALAVMLNRALANASRENKAFVAVAFALVCAFSALSFLPQKDGVNPLRKLAAGQYPAGPDLYFGLLRLGIDAPALRPPPQQEKPL